MGGTNWDDCFTKPVSNRLTVQYECLFLQEIFMDQPHVEETGVFGL